MSQKPTIITTSLILIGILVYLVFNFSEIVVEQGAEKKDLAQNKRKDLVAYKPTHVTLIAKIKVNRQLTQSDQVTFDEEHSEQTQVYRATHLIDSSKEADRLEGVEMLGAYPTIDSEALLTKLLLNDTSSQVRNAAALSLGSVEEPLDSTIHDLLTALEDESEDVGLNALSILENYILGLEETSDRYQIVRFQLTDKAASNQLTQNIRDTINQVLNDQ
jgi:HEAT repeat protein